jgi:hypothetical protein
LRKFRDKDGNWREQIQRLGDNIPKVAVSYSMQEDDTERGKFRVERAQEWGERTVV